MSRIEVRPAGPGDVERLVAFNQAMALETEDRHLDPETLERGVRRLLASPELGSYRIAVAADGEPVGALALTSEWSDWRAGLFWWIQSVYVLPAWRRRGVFSALFRAVADEAARAGDVCGLRLYVERDNGTAQATYRHLGMSETAYRLFELEFATG